MGTHVDDQGGGIGRADLEAAVGLLHASLKDSNESQSVEALEAALRSREAQIEAKFKAELDRLRVELRLDNGENSSLSFVIRSAVARLTEAPPNLHQATVMFAAGSIYHTGESGSGRWRIGSLVASALIVLGQSMVVVGVFTGTVLPSCARSDQCDRKGTFCSVDVGGRCWYCGSDAPLPAQADRATGGRLNEVHALDYAGFNTTLVTEVCASPVEQRVTNGVGDEVIRPDTFVQSWCDACVHAIDGHVDDLSIPILIQANVAAMGLFDWVTLVLASCSRFDSWRRA